MPDLTPEQIVEAMTMVRMGTSKRAVGRYFGVSDSVIRRAIDRWEQDGLTSRRPGQGRPPCTEPREDRAMVHAALQNPNLTAPAIRAEHANAMHQLISTSTVQRRLRKANLHSRRTKKAPKLSRKNRRDRREYVRRYGAWRQESLYKCDGRIRAWRRPGTQHIRAISPLAGGL